MMKQHSLSILPSVMLACVSLQAAGSILPEWDAGYRGAIPEVPTVVALEATEIAEEGQKAIQRAIDSVPDAGAVLLPEGVFELHRPISLRSGVVLRGMGAGKTHLKFHPIPEDLFDGPVRPAFGAIRMEGEKRSREYPIENGFTRGSSRLLLHEVDGLETGQMILVYSENDPELMYTEERWNRPWAMQSLAQIVEIAAIDGKRVHLDVPLRLDYKASLKPRLKVIDPIQEAGIEDMTVENLDPDSFNLIGIENARNCWVRRCETVNTTRGHIWINFSRFITVSGNEVHHSFDYGGGGKGYGIVAANVTTDSLITDNILHHLRHALMTKRGANGNVFSYNYSFERRRDPEGEKLLCDISIHGHYSYQNLFEGNVVEFIELADFWGPTGPYTTFLRNHVLTRISIEDHSHHSLFLGNHIVQGGFESDGTSIGLIFGGNRIAEDEFPLAPDTVQEIPASAYRSAPPDNWGDLPWPVLSGDTDGPLIPAQRRWLHITSTSHL
jgi:hypothetical protein